MRRGTTRLSDVTDVAALPDAATSVDTASTGDTGVVLDAEDLPETDTLPSERGLPVVHQVDAAAAARGEAVFGDGWPGPGIVPQLALRHLYLSWTDDLLEIYGFYTGASKYWAAFRDRYGFVADPDAPDGLPIGFRSVTAATATVTCLLCHAGESPAGGPLIGLPNSRLDLQGFTPKLARFAGDARRGRGPTTARTSAGATKSTRASRVPTRRQPPSRHAGPSTRATLASRTPASRTPATPSVTRSRMQSEALSWLT